MNFDFCTRIEALLMSTGTYSGPCPSIFVFFLIGFQDLGLNPDCLTINVGHHMQLLFISPYSYGHSCLGWSLSSNLHCATLVNILAAFIILILNS